MQAYAWLHQYAIVSSVWPYHAKVIERTGRILTSTSRWGRVGLADLNLVKRLFHTDGHYDRLLPILARYGKRVRIETLLYGSPAGRPIIAYARGGAGARVGSAPGKLSPMG